MRSKVVQYFNNISCTVVDPGFPVGGGGADLLGGTNLRCVHFLAKTYAKMKEIDPVGGYVLAAPPLDPPMLYMYIKDLFTIYYQ